MTDRTNHPIDGQIDTSGRLTSIRPPYTLAATPEAPEVNELIIRHFIKTIAEVAMAVASRKIGERKS